MALRQDRDSVSHDLSYFMDTTAEAGGFVCISTAGSGVSLDDANNVCAYDVLGSAVKPVGILLDTVVNKDLTQTHLNYYKPTEVQVGNKVTVLTRGWVTTNMILGTPTAGATAYLNASGHVSATQAHSDYPAVGRFESTKDSDGYAKVSVNLP